MKVSECIDAIVRANRYESDKGKQHLFLHGAPGIGKTDLVHAAHKILGIELTVLRANLLEPVDFNGYPFPQGDVMRFLPPEFLPKEGTEGILFIDELAQAPLATQCAAMTLVDHVPKGWQVVAASNRVTDRAGVNTLATHVCGRFTHIDVDVSRDDFQTWAFDNGVRPEIRGYIDFCPRALMDFDPKIAQEQRAFGCPRNWARASHVLNWAREESLQQLLEGTVGPGRAAELIGFIRHYRELISLDVVAADPLGTPIPGEVSQRFAMTTAITERIAEMRKKSPKGNTQEFNPYFTYMSRLPVEICALGMIDCMRIDSGLVRTPAANEWITKHRKVLMGSRS